MRASAQRQRTIDLFAVSVAMLFLEIALIRWLSTEIRIFAYVNNLVLLACFLGIGLGCYYARQPARLALTPLGLAWLLFLMMAPLVVTIQGIPLHLFKDTPWLLSAFSDTVIWKEALPTNLILKSLVGLTSTFIIFALIVLIFFPLGQALGQRLDAYGHLIRAYSINVAASLAGIWCFNALSFTYQPPWVWFFVAGLLLAWLGQRWRVRGRAMRGWLAACGALVLVMAMQSAGQQATTIWSPYQKLDTRPLPPEGMQRGHALTVNNTGYMWILNLSEQFRDAWPEIFDVPQRQFSQYDIPYLFQPQPAAVLIVGAGGGNDVAGALRNGAQHVTAVEIDPGVYTLGRHLHPESPYTRPEVEMVINDARSFFSTARQQYDLISFGLLDAHTLGSTYNNMRIDHYVYTRESFQEARQLLKPGGVLTVTFEAQRTAIADRIAGLLRMTFDQDPLAFIVPNDRWFGAGGVMFIISHDMAPVRQVVATHHSLRQFIEQHPFRPAPPPRLTTDDWPYLYLETARIPSLHLCLTVLLLSIGAGFRRFLMPRHQRINGHFFFLGAAFLLLEFQNISKMALLFGSTWIVNSFTISAILVLILLASWIVSRHRAIRLPLVYACVFVSVAIVFCVPLRTFHLLPYAPRVLVASTILNLPILFASIVFIISFSRAQRVDVAFGSNLLGAGVGGLLESVAFITGIHLVLLLVALLYAASWVALRGHR